MHSTPVPVTSSTLVCSSWQGHDFTEEEARLRELEERQVGEVPASWL